MSKKTTRGTVQPAPIDLGPLTWARTASIIAIALTDGTPDGRCMARDQLTAMAKAADAAAHWQKEAADWQSIAEDNSARLDRLRAATRAALANVHADSLGSGVRVADPTAGHAALVALAAELGDAESAPLFAIWADRRGAGCPDAPGWRQPFGTVETFLSLEAAQLEAEHLGRRAPLCTYTARRYYPESGK